jgi:transcriptional regulator with XRE-family HTH domain
MPAHQLCSWYTSRLTEVVLTGTSSVVNKLTRVLDDLGWSDQKLADLSGVGRVTITRGRLEQRNFSLEDSLAIAAALEGRIRAEDLPMKEKSRRALDRMRAQGSAHRAESAA